jgi:adenylylsulfate kinase
MPAFALWLTGLPASGKSTVAGALRELLHARGVDAVVLESDALRRILTPWPKYDVAERDLFYAALAHLAAFLVARGVPVVLDATANRRAYRDAARAAIARFAEVYVDCPLEVCAARDPKGLYRDAREGRSAALPGVQAAYEPPPHAELVLAADRLPAREAASEIAEWLERRGWIAPADMARGPAA